MAEQDKNQNRDRIKNITDRIEQGIQDLFQSDKYAQYLRVMSRFHRYSVNNTMLIYMQKPDATLVAGFGKWRDQFKRHVRRGEKGIMIIAPSPVKTMVEEKKLDPVTKQPVQDADGNVITTQREITIPFFKPVTVFDVSQTDGKPLPQLASDLTGNVQNYDIFMEALRRSSTVPINIEPLRSSVDGYFSPQEQRIAIRAGMSEVQTVSAVIHEMTHAKLHGNQNTVEEAAGKKSRNTEEVEAESVSFSVCAYYGIETGENSFGYIASWSKGRELSELKTSLETIRSTSSELISDIDRHYQEICRERETLTSDQNMEHVSMKKEQSPDPSMDMGNALHSAKQEQLLQNQIENSYSIYQLKNDEQCLHLRFMNSDWLQRRGFTPQKENYELIYTGTLQETGSMNEKLEGLYRKFNIEIPDDFHGHSLSVSDVVELNQQGKISYHYVDSVGYKELPEFGKINPLKTAEMLEEDDYGMIDGIMNNESKTAEKAGREMTPSEKRPSVLAQIRELQMQSAPKQATHRIKEKEHL